MHPIQMIKIHGVLKMYYQLNLNLIFETKLLNEKKHVFAFKTSIKHTNFLQIILLMFSELFTSEVCVTQ